MNENDSLLETITGIERGFWLGGADAYERGLTADAVMVFPEPAGVMEREAIVASIAEAPRWTEVEMDGARVVRPSESTVVLVYRATARRAGDAGAYVALCTSVYADEGAGWRMAAHQQTPAT